MNLLEIRNTGVKYHFIKLAELTLILSLVGCSSIKVCDYKSPATEAKKINIESKLSEVEQSNYLKVREQINTKKEAYYHSAVVAPQLLTSPYPFYLLGIEKPRGSNKTRPYCKFDDDSCNFPKFNPSGFKGVDASTIKDVQKNIFEDSRPLVLTHILSISNQPKSEDSKNCFIFNTYGHDTGTAWCNENHKIDIAKPDWTRQGWVGLDKLSKDIESKVSTEKPTHIILMATGWNTREHESYLDFQAWIEKIANDFKISNEDFRPIFIGTAWESEWPLWERLPFVSEFTKANDADEIGYTWQNYLLNDLIVPIAQSSGAQLVVIGHSFGSRVALSSHYAKDVLIRDNSTSVPLTIIGLQAAFPVNRFISEKGKEHQYISENKQLADVIITSSDSDSATGKMCIGTAYVGAGCGLEKLKENLYENAVTVANTDTCGEPQNVQKSQNVIVYDASPFVSCQLENTKSGSHSDVYDNQMGHFLGESIRQHSKVR